MTMQDSWDTRIRRTREQGNQSDDTDVHARALMLQIHIRILSSVTTHDMAFNPYATNTMVIAHMNLTHKMHWYAKW